MARRRTTCVFLRSVSIGGVSAFAASFLSRVVARARATTALVLVLIVLIVVVGDRRGRKLKRLLSGTPRRIKTVLSDHSPRVRQANGLTKVIVTCLCENAGLYNCRREGGCTHAMQRGVFCSFIPPLGCVFRFDFCCDYCSW